MYVIGVSPVVQFAVRLTKVLAEIPLPEEVVLPLIEQLPGVSAGGRLAPLQLNVFVEELKVKL